jgi:hypothetical protein
MKLRFDQVKFREWLIVITPADKDAHLADLQRIEQAVAHLPIPVGFSDQHYELRANIDFVRG